MTAEHFILETMTELRATTRAAVEAELTRRTVEQGMGGPMEPVETRPNAKARASLKAAAPRWPRAESAVWLRVLPAGSSTNRAPLTRRPACRSDALGTVALAVPAGLPAKASSASPSVAAMSDYPVGPEVSPESVQTPATGMLGSRRCPICDTPLGSRPTQETCSAKCRAERWRRQRATNHQSRDQEIRALAEMILALVTGKERRA